MHRLFIDEPHKFLDEIKLLFVKIIKNLCF